MSVSNRGAAPDTTPGNSVPTGPSRNQPETNNQKDFAEQLNISQQIPIGATKGEASDIISNTLNSGSGNGSGAAEDTTPGSVKPTGPSAEQNATRNQKAYLGTLGAADQLTQDTTKGEASEMIDQALGSGAKPSGAAADTTPGSQVPTGPSRNQPATNNQKTLIDSLGASDQLAAGATKGDASDLISQSQN